MLTCDPAQPGQRGFFFAMSSFVSDKAYKGALTAK